MYVDVHLAHELEPGLSRPETIPSPDPLTRLREQFELPAEIVEQGEKCIKAASDILAPLCITDEQRASVETYLSLTAWRLFGEPGDPLPKNTILLENKDSNALPEIVTDARLPYHDIEQLVYQVVGKDIFTDLNKNIKTFLNAQKPDIRQSLSEILAQSDVTAFLLSFAAPQPEVKKEPLNPYWRRVREAHIDEDVRLKYGLAVGATLFSGTSEWHERARRVNQLDDQEQDRVTDTKKDSIDRARIFFTTLYERVFNEENRIKNGKTFTSISFPEEQDSLAQLHFVDNQGKNHTIATLHYDAQVANLFLRLIGSNEEQDGALQSHFVRSFLFKLHSFSAASLEEMVANANAETTGEVTNSLVRSKFTTGGETSHYIDCYSNGLLRPTKALEATPIVSRTSFSRGNERRQRSRKSWYDALHGSYEVNRAFDYSIGTVIAHDRTDHVSSRLLFYDQDGAAKPLPETNEHGQADLIISIGLSDGDLPQIPGYSTVAIRDGRMKSRVEFIKNPEGDPYATCDVPIPQENLHELLEAYETIGLFDLAKALNSPNCRTISQAVQIIQQHSRYIDFDLSDVKQRISKLSEFAVVVKDGKLETQCTGAASFLSKTLNLLYGNTVSCIVGGQLITNGEKEITSTGHAQVLFAHNGYQYLLDSTPHSNTTVVANATPKENDNIHAPKAQPILQEQRPNPTPEKLPEKSPEEQHQELLARVELFITAHLNAKTSQEMTKRVADLPKHHLVREALRLIRSPLRGNFSASEVEASIDKVARYQKLQEEGNKKLTLLGYSPPLLSQLHKELSRLLSIFS